MLYLAEQKVDREFEITPGIIIGGDNRVINDCILHDNHNYYPLQVSWVVIAS